MTESMLIKECQRGNTAAFGELYDAYIRPVYGFIFLKTRHKETAEDLTSETFLRALKHIARVDPDRPFIAWLYTIARNAVRDHYRARVNAPHTNIEDVWDLASEDDPSEAAQVHEISEQVAQQLRTLKPHERDMVIMRVWQELSYEEIAAITGKSVSASKMTYSRTIAKLRKSMPGHTFAFMFVMHLII